MKTKKGLGMRNGVRVRGLRSVFALALMVSACGGETASDSPEALCRAARYGEREKAVALLAQGAEYQKAAVGYGVTPLHWAAMDDNADIVAAILQRAKADGRLQAVLDARDVWNCTPLMWAASEGHIEVVETLVTAGAGINLRGSAGDTALHLAVLSVKKSAQRVVKRLLAAGADPAITNAAGHAAGAWARLQGRADMAALIQSAGRGTP